MWPRVYYTRCARTASTCVTYSRVRLVANYYLILPCCGLIYLPSRCCDYTAKSRELVVETRSLNSIIASARKLDFQFNFPRINVISSHSLLHLVSVKCHESRVIRDKSPKMLINFLIDLRNVIMINIGGKRYVRTNSFVKYWLNYMHPRYIYRRKRILYNICLDSVWRIDTPACKCFNLFTRFRFRWPKSKTHNCQL